jgi:hypothetical protein
MIEIKGSELGPKDFVVANHDHVLQLETRITELEKRLEGLYDIIEELLKRMDQL